MFARKSLGQDTLEALGAVADTIAQGIERKRAEEKLAPHCGEGSLPADSIIEFSAPSLSSVKLWDFQLSFLRCGFYKFAILCQHLLCLIEREND